jgi:hypothetical protein
VVVLDARARKEAVERFQVLVRQVGAAMEQQHFDARIVADSLRPDVKDEGAAVADDADGPRV